MTNNFWKNISRYPNFFISSMVGLILIILTPFRNLFKNTDLKLKFLIIIFLLFLLFILYIIIANMLNL
uniref:Uncharacterized protein ycf33 n=1 Tax=Toxarium undulatum TaxID=210620 RepID=A0A1D8D9I1_9STRA|nr:hypothetical protein [Toxarium undulatum]AOS86606.1 hypothetical protein [Toxarium undulatum]